MKGVVVTAYDAPLALVELQPEPLLPGHARIEVLACGVCFSDVKIARGRMPFSARLALPHVPGHEIAGRVVESDPPGAIPAGALVTVYNVWPCGLCDRCRAGDEHICRAPAVRAGFTEPGGLREEMIVPLDRLLVVPPGIDPVHAAPLTCALGTAYRAVVTRGEVRAGQRVAVIGLGGVGIHALQVAVAAGARAVGVDRAARTLEHAAGMGLDVIDAGSGELDALLLDRTAGLGFDVVVDTVGHETTMADAIELVRPGGRVVAVGYAVGAPFVLPSPHLVLSEISVVGSRYGRRDDIEHAIRLVAEGRVEVVVDRVVAMEEAEAAFSALEAGEAVGRLVIGVNGHTSEEGSWNG
jgi:2-desacetyl-2-hydroxyethyl bacteriochlorophyllide A dehydrogenase